MRPWLYQLRIAQPTAVIDCEEGSLRLQNNTDELVNWAKQWPIHVRVRCCILGFFGEGVLKKEHHIYQKWLRPNDGAKEPWSMSKDS